MGWRHSWKAGSRGEASWGKYRKILCEIDEVKGVDETKDCRYVQAPRQEMKVKTPSRSDAVQSAAAKGD